MCKFWRLVTAKLELTVFDDADLEMEEAGLVGLAAVPLASLAEGMPLHGSFPLYNRQREVTGHVVVSIEWKAPFAPSQVN